MNKYKYVYLSYPDLSIAHSSNFGAYFHMKMSAANLAVIDIFQHNSISVPVLSIWDEVTLTTSFVICRLQTIFLLARSFSVCLWQSWLWREAECDAVSYLRSERESRHLYFNLIDVLSKCVYIIGISTKLVSYRGTLLHVCHFAHGYKTEVE